MRWVTNEAYTLLKVMFLFARGSKDNVKFHVKQDRELC